MIIEPEGRHDIESFYDNIWNERFYFSNRYSGDNSTYIAGTVFKISCDDNNSTTYNKKIQE